MQLGAGIIYAVADHRPAVVLALADDVDFIAAARAVLGLPQVAGRGIDGEALLIAMTVAPDLRLRAGAADEGIVLRHRAVRRNADQLAEMVIESLRLIAAAIVFAERDKQVAVRGLYDAATEVIARR